VIAENGGPVHLYHNETLVARANHWVRVFLNTRTSPWLAPNGYGAHVVATTPDGREQHRWIAGSTSYLSQSELSAHFGLGNSSRATIRVEWPDASATMRWSVSADRTITIAACAADWNADGVVTPVDILDFLSQWFEGLPAGSPNLAGGGTISDIFSFLNAWFAGC
jgi:hypothetical protein